MPNNKDLDIYNADGSGTGALVVIAYTHSSSQQRYTFRPCGGRARIIGILSKTCVGDSNAEGEGSCTS
jgi:hypothetical protein